MNEPFLDISHVAFNRPPFTLYPKSGWKGSIRHLFVKLRDGTLSGYPVREFTADIPSPIWGMPTIKAASWYEMLGKEQGRWFADHHDFVAKKYQGLFSNFSVAILPHGDIRLSGQLNFLGEQLPVDIQAKLIMTPLRRLVLRPRRSGSTGVLLMFRKPHNSHKSCGRFKLGFRNRGFFYDQAITG